MATTTSAATALSGRESSGGGRVTKLLSRGERFGNEPTRNFQHMLDSEIAFDMCYWVSDDATIPKLLVKCLTLDS